MVLLDEIGHLVSTKNEEELHKFARELGLKRAWFQPKTRPHYDVMSDRIRQRALFLGAESVKGTELVKRAYWTIFCTRCGMVKRAMGAVDGELICGYCQ